MRIRYVVSLAAPLIAISGIAWAGSASSATERFADWGSGSGRRCATQQSAVYTPPSVINAYGIVRYKTGDPCELSNAPSGYIGVREYLQRPDGTICASRTWDYNSGPVSELWVPTNQGQGSCNSWSSLRAAAMARVYKPSTGQYVTADAYVISPYQS